MIDHTTSDARKAAMSKLKDEQVGQSGSSVVLSLATGQSFLNLDDGTRQRMRKRFDICYMMAKESISLVKHPT